MRLILPLALALPVAGCGGSEGKRPAPPPAVVPVEGGFVDHAFSVRRGEAFAFGGLVVRAQKGRPVTLLAARPSRPSSPLEFVAAYSAGAGRKLFGFQSSLKWPEGEQTRIRALAGTRVGARKEGVQVIVRVRTTPDARKSIAFDALDFRIRDADGGERTVRIPVSVRVCPRGPTERELLARDCPLPPID